MDDGEITPQSAKPGKPPQNGKGIAALVLGILGLILTLCFSPFIILSVLAIIFGALGIRDAKAGNATNRGMSIAGLVMGLVAIAVFVALALVVGSLFVFSELM